MPTKPWRELEKTMTPDQLARSDAMADALRVGHLVNQLRKQQGLTQTQLAEKMGVTQQAVSKIEWGEDIQLSTLQKVFSVLGGEIYLHTSGRQIPLAGVAVASSDMPNDAATP